jgi:hypothetical protein
MHAVWQNTRLRFLNEDVPAAALAMAQNQRLRYQRHGVIWPPKKSLRKASLSGRCKKLLQAGGEGLVTKPGRKYTNKCSAITANSG